VPEDELPDRGGGEEEGVMAFTAKYEGVRLEPVLVRMHPEHKKGLKDLVRRTRIKQADYLREAIADLLEKYRQRPEEGPCR
jgi:hypothetical protein